MLDKLIELLAPHEHDPSPVTHGDLFRLLSRAKSEILKEGPPVIAETAEPVSVETPEGLPETPESPLVEPSTENAPLC